MNNDSIKAKYSFLFPLLFFFFSLFMCVGYAAINSISSEISGVANATAQQGVFITDVVYSSDKDADLASSEILNLYKTMFTSKIALSSTNGQSTVTYTVSLYNNSSYEYAYIGYNYGNDFYDNTNITFSISGLSEGDRITANGTKTFSITFSYVDKNNIPKNVLNSSIEFLFGKAYNVKYNNIVDNNYPKEAVEGKVFNVTLPYVNANYIEVKMNNTVLSLNNGFSYDTTNRTLTINDVTGDIEITYDYTPVVAMGDNNTLIPVIHNGDRWKITSTDRDWYDYDNQHWANAVILVENERDVKEPGDSLSVAQNNIEAMAMFVWIPRFEYKIEGTYGTHTDGTAGTALLPGEIKVNFIPSEQTIASPGYRIHPAFTFDGKNLSGIWVGKFETSHSTLSTSTTSNNLGCTNENCSNADGLVILPDVETLKYNSVSNFYYAARSMSRSGNPFGINSSVIDTHMMKDSEWGAVAYLTQSKYGKYGNVTYTGANKEIYQNKSLITGQSNGTPSQDDYSDSQCTYDDIADRGSGKGACGAGASTTGNIYGIYDMSGASNEYVMGYLTTASSTWGATSSNNNAGFNSQPAAKYFDGFTSTTSSQACNGGICYGHALDETAGWYSDSVSFLNEGSPWMLRGGRFEGGINNGAFYYSRTNGGGSNSRAFRVILTSQ